MADTANTEQNPLLSQIFQANSQLIKFQLQQIEEGIAKKYAVLQRKTTEVWELDKSIQERSTQITICEQQLMLAKQNAQNGGLGDNEITGVIEKSKQAYIQEISMKIYTAHHYLQRVYLNLLKEASEKNENIELVNFPTEHDYNVMEEIGIAQAEDLGLSGDEIEDIKEKALTKWKEEVVIEAQKFQTSMKELHDKEKHATPDQLPPLLAEEQKLTMDRNALYKIVKELDIVNQVKKYYSDFKPPQPIA